MKLRMLAGVVMAVIIGAGAARTQEQSMPADNGSETVTQLKLQVVLTEMDGSKKIGNLPYILRVSASAHPTDTKLRDGVRVPVVTGTKDKDVQTTYLDVGTIIDVSAKPVREASYQLHLAVERSMVYPTGTDNKPSVAWAPGDPAPSVYPLIGTFREECDLAIRDGQTLQSVASDPVSGHTMTMDVTINVEK